MHSTAGALLRTGIEKAVERQGPVIGVDEEVRNDEFLSARIVPGVRKIVGVPLIEQEAVHLPGFIRLANREVCIDLFKNRFGGNIARRRCIATSRMP